MSHTSDNDERAILHVDMDAFYASVEVMDNPDLAGKPVIVGGTPEGRGVVSAASYEAREFGVHSAMSAFRARKLCPHGVFITPRMSRYAGLSRDIRAIFAEYTPLIEPISLDEAFLDVTGSRTLFGDEVTIARTIKRRIRDEVGLVASVGVAPNKFLAKLASDLEKPDGFVVIPQAEAAARLAPLPVGRLWGVGKVSQKTLAGVGIHTIGDIARTPVAQLAACVGSYAARLHALSLGLDDRPVVADGEARSISAETTFARDIGEASQLREALDRLSDRVARRTRKSGLEAFTVHIKARYSDFTTVTRAASRIARVCAVASGSVAARELLEVRLDRRSRPLRLLGVGVSNLVPAGREPMLFEDDRVKKDRSIDTVVDSLEDRFGTGVVRRGGRGGRDRGPEDD